MFDVLHPDLMQFVRVVGYPGIFAIIFLESGVFFGFFLPGASLLFSAGVLAAANVLNVWILIPLVVIAAILGDNVGYWFGKKVGVRLFLRPDSRFFHHEHLRQAKEFYDRHGALAIMLARFVPVIRTFAPIVGGVVHMNYRTFVLYNIAGALLWGAGVALAGFLLGRSIPNIGAYLEPIIAVIIVVTTAPLLWHWYKNKTALRQLPESHEPS